MPAARITETSTEVTLTVGTVNDTHATLLGYIEIAKAERELANSRRLDAHDSDEREIAWQDFDKCCSCIAANEDILASLVSFG